MPHETPGPFKLRLLATSDLHMRVMSYDYLLDRPDPGIGLQSLADLIETARAEAAAETPPRTCVLVDNGDILEGSALAQRLAGDPALCDPHPVAEVMNALGYDAVGVGNHDLDYGLSYLGQFARSLAAPLVSSNLLLSPQEDWLSPSALLDRGGTKFGILSVLPPRSVHWSYAATAGRVDVAPMVETVRTTAQTLRDQGADLIIGLVHSGLGYDPTENALSKIAQAGEVDLLVGGHTHVTFPVPGKADTCGANHKTGTVHNVPTVMPGPYGQSLGVLDFDLPNRISSAQLRPSRACTTEPAAIKPIARAHNATLAHLAEEVGRSTVNLNSYFAHLCPSPMLALICAAQRHAIDHARQGTIYADMPLLSVAAPSLNGEFDGPDGYTDIPAGRLTRRHISQLDAYANQIWAVAVTGDEIAEWLEMSASVFAQISPTRDIGLRNPEVPGFHFDVMHGLGYAINPTAPPRYDGQGQIIHTTRRMSDITYQGEPLRRDQTFLVATKSYRACGGGNFPGLHPDRAILRPDADSSEVFSEYVSTPRPTDQIADWRWHPDCKGVTTWIETGPNAAAHLQEIAQFTPGTAYPQTSGFFRIPVTL